MLFPELDPPVPCKVNLCWLLASVAVLLLAIIALLIAPPALAANKQTVMTKALIHHADSSDRVHSLSVVIQTEQQETLQR